MTEKQDTKELTKDEKTVEFIPFGASEKLRLTAAMVRHFIAVPTKSGKLPSERDCMRFIMLCRGKRANPFEGDCYLIGYDTQNGPQFSMVCGVELFQKRAESSETYEGMESGIVVLRDGQIEYRPGTILVKGEQLIGGWCKVYRSDRKKPEFKTVNFNSFDTGKSIWQKDPAGMIEKVARSQALRAAYPTALGGLYTQEEMEKVTESGQGLLAADAEIEEEAALEEHQQVIDIEPPEPEEEAEEEQEQEPVAAGRTAPF